MGEAEPLCAENIGLKDISQSCKGELISWGETNNVLQIPGPTLQVTGSRSNLDIFASGVLDTRSWGPTCRCPGSWVPLFWYAPKI